MPDRRPLQYMFTALPTGSGKGVHITHQSGEMRFSQGRKDVGILTGGREHGRLNKRLMVQ